MVRRRFREAQDKWKSSKHVKIYQSMIHRGRVVKCAIYQWNLITYRLSEYSVRLQDVIQNISM